MKGLARTSCFVIQDSEAEELGLRDLPTRVVL